MGHPLSASEQVSVEETSVISYPPFSITDFLACSGYGHDKSQAILPYRALPDPPTIFFFGDGVSGPCHLSLRLLPAHSATDMSAARHADVLFVKQKEDGENDLALYCKREEIPHILFDNFGRALEVVRSVVEGKKTVQEVLAAGKA